MWGPLYYCDTLSMFGQNEIIDLCEAYWPMNNEHLWLGDIHRDNLVFDSHHESINIASTYFQHEHYKTPADSITDYDCGNQQGLERFAKLVWLLREYLDNQGFTNPVGAHYNPRLDVNVIHPGGSRNQILNLFGPDYVKAYYFNTRGYHPDWLNNLSKVDLSLFEETNKLKNNFSLGFNVVPDHGTIIPHVIGDTELIPKGIKQAQGLLHHTLTGNFSIKFDCNLKCLMPWQDHSENHNVEVLAHNDLNVRDIVKIILLCFSNHSYHDTRFSVLCKKPIS